MCVVVVVLFYLFARYQVPMTLCIHHSFHSAPVIPQSLVCRSLSSFRVVDGSVSGGVGRRRSSLYRIGLEAPTHTQRQAGQADNRAGAWTSYFLPLSDYQTIAHTHTGGLFLTISLKLKYLLHPPSSTMRTTLRLLVATNNVSFSFFLSFFNFPWATISLGIFFFSPLSFLCFSFPAATRRSGSLTLWMIETLARAPFASGHTFKVCVCVYVRRSFHHSSLYNRGVVVSLSARRCRPHRRFSVRRT